MKKKNKVLIRLLLAGAFSATAVAAAVTLVAASAVFVKRNKENR